MLARWTHQDRQRILASILELGALAHPGKSERQKAFHALRGPAATLSLTLALSACGGGRGAGTEAPPAPPADVLRATIAALPTTDPSLAGGPPPPQADPGKAVDPIEGPIWIAKSVGASKLEPLDGAEITARFLAGGLSGSAGCNTYAGRFRLDGDRILIEEVFASEMMCSAPEGVMGMESAFLGALATASHYRVDAGWLTLSDAGGTSLLRFQASGDK